MNKAPVWLGPARLPVLALTPACLLLGLACVQWTHGQLALREAALVLFGALAAHVSVNAFNEYLDFRSGLDALTERTPFSGGSGVLPTHPELAGLTLAMVSLAGIPPLVGFFGKFLLIKAALASAAQTPVLYGIVGVAIVGVVISLYYYFGVIRAIYWRTEGTPAPLAPSMTARLTVGACMAGVIILGVFPASLWNKALQAVAMLPLAQ